MLIKVEKVYQIPAEGCEECCYCASSRLFEGHFICTIFDDCADVKTPETEFKRLPECIEAEVED